MRYADTCLLVSLFFRDAGIDAAPAWLRAAGVEPIMAAGLAGDYITERFENANKIGALQIAREPHTARTSSRTKCSLTTLGALPSSKWQRTASRTCLCRLSISSASVKMDSPSARAVNPPSGASSTTKIISFSVGGERKVRRQVRRWMDQHEIRGVMPKAVTGNRKTSIGVESRASRRYS